MPKITRESLTKRTVESAETTGKLYRLRHNDPNGLVLRVSATGSKTWAVTWGRGQERVIGTYPVMTLTHACAEARKQLAEVDQHGAPLGGRKSVDVETFGDFMKLRYGPHVEATAKAGAATHANIKAQFEYLYPKRLSEITRAEFDKFKADRLKAGLHPSTVNRDLDRIKAALTTAVLWKLIPANPLLGTKRIKRGIEDRVRYLAPDEEKALRNELSARDKRFQAKRDSANAWRSARGRATLPTVLAYCDHVTPMTLVGINTGLRRGELTQLTWADIDLPGKMLTVRAGYAKSGKARYVPLNSEAVSVLEQWKKQHASGRLFAVASLAKAWAGLVTASKIPNFRFHDLRHTFASKLVMAGVDLNTVRELLGHGDIKMTLRYAHLAPKHKAAAVEALVASV